MTNEKGSERKRNALSDDAFPLAVPVKIGGRGEAKQPERCTCSCLYNDFRSKLSASETLTEKAEQYAIAPERGTVARKIASQRKFFLDKSFHICYFDYRNKKTSYLRM